MTIEDVKRTVREHADQTQPGWRVAVVTIHDEQQELLAALKVFPDRSEVTSAARPGAAEDAPLLLR